MNDEFTNLLPLERQKIVRRRYFIRLAVVAVTLVTALVIAAAILLIPTYVYLVQNISEKGERLEAINASIPDVNQKELSARFIALSNNTKVLTELSKTTPVETILKAILDASRPGISLNGFIYTPVKPGTKVTPATLVVNGTSQTRDALRAYQLELQKVSFVATAVLPVSAYAQSENIPFSITLTLKL